MTREQKYTKAAVRAIDVKLVEIEAKLAEHQARQHELDELQKKIQESFIDVFKLGCEKVSLTQARQILLGEKS